MTTKTRHFSPLAKRACEILPGLLTWAALIAPFVFSVYYPAAVAVFVIVFDLYWLFASIEMTFNIVRVYRRMKAAKRINWASKLIGLDDLERATPSGLTNKTTYQAIVMVAYKEPLELLQSSLQSYVDAHYDLKHRTIFVLGTEERALEHGNLLYEALRKEFAGKFLDFQHAIHPKNLPGEIKCKSANATWAAKKLKTIIDEMNIKPEQVIVHNFDADTRTHPQYFSYVQWNFLHTPAGRPTSYQPIHIYNNNIWHTGAPMRVIAISSTFIFMHNTLRPAHFYNFSSRSDNFKTIVDIGYWTVNAIPEDSRQYYDAFFHYKGNITIQPQFIPLELDAVLADGYWSSLQNQYRQLRRWAWGVVDFAYAAEKSWIDTDISWWTKLGRLGEVLENHFNRGTSAIFLGVVAWLPLSLNKNFSHSVLGHNLIPVSQLLLGLAAVGLITMIFFSYLLLPPKPKTHGIVEYIGFATQWVLAPIISIFLNCFSTIDAQTRLMFGRYLEYQVTEKTVVRK